MLSNLSSRTLTWAAALFFLACSLVLNRELLPHLSTTLPGNAGDPMLNAWILGWVSESVITNPGGLWHAPIFHPHPNALAFSEHLMGIAVFVAPVYWLTGNAILTYNAAFLLGFAFLGWATFALVRAITGRADAALIGGLVVMCSPYFVSSQVARLQMLTAGWSLLTFLWLHRWLERDQPHGLAAFAVCWAIQLKSNIYLGLFLAVPISVLLAAAFARRTPSLTLRRAGQLAVAAVALVAVSAPVLLQYADVQDNLGLSHTLDEVRRYSAAVRSYASIWHERGTPWLWPEISSDRALFPGALLSLLALIGTGLALLRQRTNWRPGHGPAVYILVAAVVFVLTLGPEPAISTTPLGIPGPFAWLAAIVPGFEGIRAPGRFAIFVILSLGVLAGVGAAALLAGRGRALRASAVIVTAAISLWDGHRDYDWLAHLDDEHPSATAAYEWLATQPKTAMLEMPVVADFQSQRPLAGASVTLRYQLAGLRHGHTLVNGSSGFASPLVMLLESSASPFSTLDTVDDALRVLRAIGTRYIVLHRHEYRSEVLRHVAEVEAAMRADAEQVERVIEFDTTTILQLRTGALAAPPVRRARLARASYDIEVSHNGDVAHQMTDDALQTRWMAPQHGRTWVEARLGRAKTVAGVKLVMPRWAVADYPHHLRVVGTDTDGNDHVLYEGPTVYHTAITAVLEPKEPGLRITWSPLALTKVRLEQPVWSGDRQWAIYELHLLGDQELPREEPPSGVGTVG